MTLPRVVVVELPEDEPVTLEELKDYLRVGDSVEDGLIAAYGVAARVALEDDLQVSLLPQVLDHYFDAVPDDQVLRLPRGPITSVTSVTVYSATDEASIVATSVYRAGGLGVIGTPARVTLKSGQVWPTDLRAVEAVVVRTAAGYADVAAVPEPLKLAIKVIVASWSEQRELGTIPAELGALLMPYRAVVLA